MRYEITEGKNMLIVDSSGVHFTNRKDYNNGIMRTLPFDQIGSVEYVSALLAGGSLFFKHISDTSTQTKGVVALQHEPNAFAFSKTNADAAMQIKAAVDSKIAELKPSAAPTVVNVAGSDADELLKFKSLLDSGVITQEEFDKKKAQLLGF